MLKPDHADHLCDWNPHQRAAVHHSGGAACAEGDGVAEREDPDRHTPGGTMYGA